MATWLVTGGTGFLGRHVLAALRDPSCPAERVVAIGRRPPSGLEPAAFRPADLEDPRSVARAVAELAPNVVIHAAGQTPPADPERFEQVNTRGTIHLLAALKSLGQPVRVVLVGSAAELGPVGPDHLPVDEDYPCRPADAYARSKWYATTAGLLARRPLEVVVARVFNPIGPGMPATQVFGRFAGLLAAPGPDPLHLPVGDLDVRRDFVDARDVATALIALGLWGRPGLVYHVGTGRSRRVGDGLGRLIALSGRCVVLEPDGSPARGPADSRAAIGRIVDHTGWQPRISWETSLADLWNAAQTAAAGRPSQHVA